MINFDVARHLPGSISSSVGGFRHRLLIADLKLSQKDILCEGIGIGNGSTWTTPLVVAKLVID